MTVPDWRTSTKGTKVRAALWLHAEVGVGGTFTKQQLRDAFPSVEQVDRRMRDLRPEGWVIATYREDRSLTVDELRLVAEGGRVWEPGYRSRQGAAVSDKQRQEVFAGDNYCCVLCGISAGEAYPDDPLRSAQLTLARNRPPGDETAGLRTECDRCRAGSPPNADAAGVTEQIAGLSPDDREQLAGWVRSGSRGPVPLLDAWAAYRRLPLEGRQAVAGTLLGR